MRRNVDMVGTLSRLMSSMYPRFSNIALPVSVAERRIKTIPQPIGKMVENKHKSEYRQCDERHLPPHALPQSETGVVYHYPPARLTLHSYANNDLPGLTAEDEDKQ